MILNFLDHRRWLAAYTFIFYAITSTVHAVPEPVPPGFETGDYHDPRADIECMTNLQGSPFLLRSCAKPGYGGTPGANAGAYCNWRQWDDSSIFASTYATLTFEPPTIPLFDDIVAQIKCNAKCWCKERPNTELPLDQAYPLRPPVPPTMKALPDLRPLATGTQPRALTMDGSIMARSIVFMPEEDVYADSQTRVSRFWVAAYAGNSAIMCTGGGSAEAVPMTSPQRQILWPWLSEQQICASEQWGGFPSGNAGGNCMNGMKHFSTIIAHPRLTFRTQVGRYWLERCTRNCACTPHIEPPDTPDKALRIRAQQLLRDLMAQHKNTAKTIDQLGTVLGSLSTPPHSARGSQDPRRADGTRPQTNPAMVGQKEAAPGGRRRKAIPGRPQTGALQAPGTCGGPCDGPGACSRPTAAGSGPLPHSCSCVADPSMVQVQAAGLDPVFPHAACFPVAGLSSAGGLAVAFGLGKRGNPTELGSGFDAAAASSSSWPCVCNATYVSRACCGSADGLVWEDAGGRLGRLAV